MSCFNDLIGVSNKQEALPFYDTLNDDLVTAMETSASGLYMDTLTGGIDLLTLDNQDFMVQVLQAGWDAKKQAEITTRGDLSVAINNRYQAAKKAFNGNIGRTLITTTIAPTGNLQGLRFRMEEPVGGFITISRIQLAVNIAQSFNIYIAQCNAHDQQATVIYTIPINSVANSFATAQITVPGGLIKLPMQVEGLAQEYYIYWDRTEAGGASPKNNQLRCYCANDPLWSAMDYMNIQGMGFTDINNLFSHTADLNAHGLSILARVACDDETVFCREFEDKDVISTVMGWAELFKAGELWIEYVLKTNTVNRETMQSREYLWGKRNHFRTEYETRIQWLVSNMTLDDTNCYKCREDKMFKGKILA